MYRKGFILCLAVLLAFQSMGYYYAFLAQYGLHKSAMQEAVTEAEEEQLTFLSLSDAEYHQLVWAGKREFWYDGVLHDHKVTMRTPEGNWKVMCMRDEAETRMLAEAGGILKTDHTQKKGSSMASPLWLSVVYFPLDPIVIQGYETEQPVFPDFVATFSESALEIPAPPPRFC